MGCGAAPIGLRLRKEAACLQGGSVELGKEQCRLDLVQQGAQ